jgi:hypothetical protein
LKQRHRVETKGWKEVIISYRSKEKMRRVEFEVSKKTLEILLLTRRIKGVENP